MSTHSEELSTDVYAPSLAPVLNSAEASQPVPASDSKPWAVVFIGRQPGVFFNGGERLMANVHSIPGSVIVKYHTEADARDAYSTALANHKVERVTLEHKRTVVVESLEEPLAISAFKPDVSTWRVVFVGREPGVFADESHILENVLSIPEGRCQKFETYDGAVRDFKNAVEGRLVFRVHWKLTRETLVE